MALSVGHQNNEKTTLRASDRRFWISFLNASEKLRHAPKKLVVEDWATNPRIVTDLDLSQPAAHPEIGPTMLRQPFLDGRVRFAVSEASDLSPGLIEGALAIGERAASELLGTNP